MVCLPGSQSASLTRAVFFDVRKFGFRGNFLPADTPSFPSASQTLAERDSMVIHRRLQSWHMLLEAPPLMPLLLLLLLPKLASRLADVHIKPKS
jgi:hypothetical protein